MIAYIDQRIVWLGSWPAFLEILAAVPVSPEAMISNDG